MLGILLTQLYARKGRTFHLFYTQGVWLSLTFGAVGHFVQIVKSDSVQEVLLHQLMKERVKTTVLTDVVVYVCVCVCVCVYIFQFYIL